MWVGQFSNGSLSAIPPGCPRLEDDFDYLAGQTDGRWTLNSNVGGGMGGIASTSAQQGVVSLTALNATSFACFTRGLGQLILPNLFWQLNIGINLPALSTAADRFVIRAGIADSGTVNPANGVWFEYSDNESAGNWQGVTAVGGVRTLTSLGFPAATGLASMRVNGQSNALATFNLNGVTLLSQGVTFPTGIALGLMVGIFNSSATVLHTLLVDYFGYYYNIAR